MSIREKISKIVRLVVFSLLLTLPIVGSAKGKIAKEEEKEERTREREETVLMEEVVVTATRTESPVENLPQNITVIPKEDMEKMHVKTVDDILQNVAGIEVIRSFGLSCSGWVIMRGVGSHKRTLVLKDGIPLNTASYGGFSSWNQLSTGNIDRIEVIRGASSALYGSDAMGGVINIVTKEPAEELEGDLSCEYGSQNTHLYDLNLRGKKFDWLGFRLSAGSKSDDGYRFKEPWLDYDEYTTMDEYNISPGIDIKLGKSKLNLQWRRSDQETVWTSYAKTKYEDSIDEYMLDFQVPVEDVEYSAKLYYQDADDKSDSNKYNAETEKHDTPYSNANCLKDDGGIMIQATREILGQRFTFGSDLKWGKIDSDNYYTGKGTRHYDGDQKQYSGFLNGELFLGEKTALNLGARYDWWKSFDGNFYDDTIGKTIETCYEDRTDDNWSPSAGVTHHITENIRFRTSFGTGFRAPTLYNLYSNSIYGTTLYAGNPELKPEKMTYSADCGFDISFPNGINLTLTSYKSSFKDYIGWITVGLEELPAFIEPGTVDQIRKTENIGEVDIHGVEIGIDKAFSALFGQWRASANYAYNESKVVSCKDPTLEDKFLCRNVPRHMATLKLTYDNPALFTLDLSVRYRGEVYLDSQNTNELPAYTVGDIKISRQLPWLTGASAFVSIDNFTDEAYQQFPQCPTDYYMPGRLTMVGMKYTF